MQNIKSKAFYVCKTTSSLDTLETWNSQRKEVMHQTKVKIVFSERELLILVIVILFLYGKKT